MNTRTVINTYLSTITSNANGLNGPIKRHKVAEWIRKKTPLHMLSTRDSLQMERHNRLKVRRWKIYLMKIETINSLGSNTYIRKNRL